MLADHISVGVPHLLGYPVNRGNPGSQQLTGVGMAALARPAIANAGRFQVRFEEPVPHDKVADVWQAALGVQEYKVQLVLADGFIVPLYDVDRVHRLELVDGVQFAQCVPRWLQQTHFARRAPSFRHPIGATHLGSAKSHGKRGQIYLIFISPHSKQTKPQVSKETWGFVIFKLKTYCS